MGGTGFPGFEVQAENVRHYFPIKEFGPQHWRRMVYMTKVRQEKDAVFGVFDCPDASQVVDKRSRSTTPLQALNLFNSTFVLQQCEILAEQLDEEFSDDVAAQVRVLYRIGRIPDEIEIDEAAEFVKEEGLVQFCELFLMRNLCSSTKTKNWVSGSAMSIKILALVGRHLLSRRASGEYGVWIEFCCISRIVGAAGHFGY